MQNSEKRLGEPIDTNIRLPTMTNTTLKDPKGAQLSSAAGKPGDAARRDSPAQPYPGEKARQGRIVLDTPARRSIFIAGLIGAVLLALAVAVSV